MDFALRFFKGERSHQILAESLRDIFFGGHCEWDQVITVVDHYCVFVAMILSEERQFRGGLFWGCSLVPECGIWY